MGSWWENPQKTPHVSAPKLQFLINHSSFRHSDPIAGPENFLQFNRPSVYMRQVETALVCLTTTDFMMAVGRPGLHFRLSGFHLLPELLVNYTSCAAGTFEPVADHSSTPSCLSEFHPTSTHVPSAGHKAILGVRGFRSKVAKPHPPMERERVTWLSESSTNETRASLDHLTPKTMNRCSPSEALTHTCLFLQAAYCHPANEPFPIHRLGTLFLVLAFAAKQP